MDYHFRKAGLSDAPAIWQILQQGIARRKAEGSDQWQDGYPNPDVVKKDIGQGAGYVLMDRVPRGMDLAEVHEVMRHVVHETRTKRRPALVHMKTYRFYGHSVSDAGLYRSKDEVDSYKMRDPIVAVGQDMIDNDWMTEDELKALQKTVKARVQDAVAFADDSPEPPLEELTRHVYKDEPENVAHAANVGAGNGGNA